MKIAQLPDALRSLGMPHFAPDRSQTLRKHPLFRRTPLYTGVGVILEALEAPDRKYYKKSAIFGQNRPKMGIFGPKKGVILRNEALAPKLAIWDRFCCDIRESLGRGDSKS